MTNLEKLLKELHFDRIVEQTGEVYWIKNMLGLQLNKNNTKIKYVTITCCVNFSIIDAMEWLNEGTKDLKALEKYKEIF